MNILLWVLQAVLAMLCISGGVFQIFKIDQLQEGVASMRALPHGLWAVLGAIGVVSGLGLILPSAINFVPVLTPISAIVVAAYSALICAFYVYYGDSAPLPWSAAMMLMAAFISYGRFVLRPF